MFRSLQALQWLRAWQAGEDFLPPGYPATDRARRRPTALAQLKDLLLAYPHVAFQHVHGHNGDPLNETADSLARLALRAADLESRQTAEQTASQWVAKRLGDQRRETSSPAVPSHS